MEGLILIIVAILSAVVLLLYMNQRRYQQIDHGYLIDQEAQEQRFNERMRYLEQMIADMAHYESKRKQELDSALETAKSELAQRVERARGEIISDVLNHPDDVDAVLIKHCGILPGEISGTPAPERRQPKANDNLVRFLRSPRQQQIAELLELGYSHQDVSRMTGVSCHEVDLVSSIIFRQESA